MIYWDNPRTCTKVHVIVKTNLMRWIYNEYILTIYVLSKNKKNITHFSKENCHFVNQKKTNRKYYDPHKAQISCAVTAELISAFVFATWTVQSLYFLNPK